MNIRNDRARVQELQERLRIYESGSGQADNISWRIITQCAKLQATQKDTIKQIDDSKRKGEFKIAKLRTLKTGA